MNEPIFLTLDEFIRLHEIQLERFGVFLRLNGFRLDADAEVLYDLTMRTAAGGADKSEIAAVLRAGSVPLS